MLDAVTRILTPLVRFGLLENPARGNLTVDSRSKAHSELARRIATEAIVLLKNDGAVLPTAVQKAQKIAMIGDHCQKTNDAAGSGSG